MVAVFSVLPRSDSIAHVVPGDVVVKLVVRAVQYAGGVVFTLVFGGVKYTEGVVVVLGFRDVQYTFVTAPLSF